MTNTKQLRYVNFNQLRSFYATARVKSFTKAAEWLNIGQPTVTMQVKALEETYNVQLFNRLQRGLELTDAGMALLTLVRQIFALEEQAVTLLKSTGNVFAGKLHIGTVGPFFVMDFLSEYSEKYPLVQVSVASGNSDTLYRQLLNYELDVAILGVDHADHKLEQILLGQHEVAIIVNKDHHWAGKTHIDLNELDGQRIILREEGSMTRKAFMDALQARGITPNVVMELSRDSVAEAVAAGLGVGGISVDEIKQDQRLALIRIRKDPPVTNSYAVCLKERLSISSINTFMTMTKMHAQNSKSEEAKTEP